MTCPVCAEPKVAGVGEELEARLRGPVVVKEEPPAIPICGEHPQPMDVRLACSGEVNVIVEGRYVGAGINQAAGKYSVGRNSLGHKGQFLDEGQKRLFCAPFYV